MQKRFSGSSIGHLLPGLLLLLTGFVLTIHSMKRSRCEQLIDKKFLLRLSLVTFLLTSTGILTEGIIGIRKGNGFFNFIVHQAAYFAFTCVGVIGIMESKSILQINSTQRFLSLACFIHSLMFYIHGMEQTEEMELAHFLLSCLYMGTSILLAFSVYHKSSVEAAIGSFVMLMITGVWYITIALRFYKGFSRHPSEHMPNMGQILSIFCFELVGILSSCYIMISIYIRHTEKSRMINQKGSELQELV